MNQKPPCTGVHRAWYSPAMTQRLTPAAIVLLIIPPLLWSGNAVVGRVVAPLVSPMTLNLLRWAMAFVLLLPLAGGVLRGSSPLWRQWRRFAFLSLFSIGGYNALLYLALNTSTPINVPLVGASTPVWMLLIGRLFFKVPVSHRQLLGAVLSIAGVLLVLSRGQWEVLLGMRLVAGDLYILIASMAWAYYSWMLVHPTPESASLRTDWAAFLLGQIVFGLGWSAAFAGAEWTLSAAHIQWGWPLVSALAFIAVAPGARGCHAPVRRWPGFSSTSRRCSRPCCPPRFWGKHRRPSMRWRLC